jgi:hypothetical protein
VAKGRKPKDEGTFPPPPAWAGAGVPEPVEDDGNTSRPIPILDERAFMQEVADRVNAFIRTYPREARRMLSAFIPYEHELAELHLAASGGSHPPGATVGGIIAAVLQTPHGYYLKPVLISGKEGAYIARVDVAVQDGQGARDWA